MKKQLNNLTISKRNEEKSIIKGSNEFKKT